MKKIILLIIGIFIGGSAMASPFWPSPQINVTCYGGSNGSLTMISAAGGTHLWSKDGGVTWQSSNVFNGLTAGTYMMGMKNPADGSVILSPSFITQPSQLLFTALFTGS